MHTLEPWYFVAFNWFDVGTMSAAKILRPPESYGCEDSSKVMWYGPAPTCDFSIARPYIITSVIEALSGYATYILAIIASLQLAHYLHWRREQSESPTPTPTTP